MGIGTFGYLLGHVGMLNSREFEGSWEGLGHYSGFWAPQAQWLWLCWETLVEVLGQLIKDTLP